MKLEAIFTENAPEAVGPYSQAIKAGKTIYVPGQLPIDPETGKHINETIEKETRQSLENAKAILFEAGATLDDVVKVTVFIQNMDDFPRINEVYSQYFTSHKPARACVEVARLPLGVNVEIEMIAMI